MALIRRVPELFGIAHQHAVYSSIATQVFAPAFGPDFAYVHWRPDYELAPVEEAYAIVHESTDAFTSVDVETLTDLLWSEPRTLLIFRLLLGYTWAEFAAATGLVVEGEASMAPLSRAKAKAAESGSVLSDKQARCAAETVVRGVDATLWPQPEGGELKGKISKPDTANGWESVRQFAAHGVPLQVLLHQRHYGGAFRQLLDATSTARGNVLEDAVEDMVRQAGIPFVRTGSQNQADIAGRFGLTVSPAPDFVFYDARDTVRAILECKGANDGGTARDKASRFRALRAEAARLGGVPVFAMLSGLGWVRAGDALGPVVAACDGRVFTAATLPEMLSVDPLPTLMRLTRRKRQRKP